ncbi:MAG: LysE family translocator [Thermodesulfobacteriota bacterium]
MFGTHDFIVFLAAGITLILMPGPDTMYILGRSIAQGRRAGFMSVLGISTGGLVHTTAAALGLSAILVASTLAFTLVKWAGAIYLVYLGLQMILRKADETPNLAGEAAGANLWTIYRQGFLTDLLNPKVAMFFMAFLPQFVNPAQASSPWPFLFLGGVFIFAGTLWCLGLAAMAATASKAIRTRAGSLSIARRVTGLVFVGLGVRLAFQDPGTSMK